MTTSLMPAGPDAQILDPSSMSVVLSCLVYCRIADKCEMNSRRPKNNTMQDLTPLGLSETQHDLLEQNIRPPGPFVMKPRLAPDQPKTGTQHAKLFSDDVLFMTPSLMHVQHMLGTSSLSVSLSLRLFRCRFCFSGGCSRKVRSDNFERCRMSRKCLQQCWAVLSHACVVYPTTNT